MTATTPLGGTSEPEPANGGATPQEPARPGQNSGGNSSGPAQQQSPAGADNEAGEGYGAIARAIAYEKLGVDPAASPRKKRRWMMVLAVLAAVLAVLPLLLEAVSTYLLIPSTVVKENDSQKKDDASQPPFVVSVQPENSEPANWTMVLDRELTTHEIQKMQESPSPFSYLQSLGGRPLAYASLLEHAPKRYRQQTPLGREELSDTFKINFLSTRTYAVVIDDWEVVDVKCQKSTAKTVVDYPPQGGAPYEGIRLHIPPWADEPVLTDDTEGQGKPYFATRFIEVGGGQPSGGLRVEAIAPPGQSCEWGIKVHYVDAHQKEQYVQLKDGNGKPIRIRTESVPENPRQNWVFGSVPWMCYVKGVPCDLG